MLRPAMHHYPTSSQSSSPPRPLYQPSMQKMIGNLWGFFLLVLSALHQSACLSRRGELRRNGYYSNIEGEPYFETIHRHPIVVRWYSPVSTVSSTARRREASLISSPKSSFHDRSKSSNGRSRMWPPWPFNLLDGVARRDSGTTRSPSQQSDASQALTRVTLLWDFLTQSAQAGLRNMQYATSQLLFHLPPAAPPLILVACLPQHRILERGAQVTETQVPHVLGTYVIPLVSDPFARNMALTCLGLAVMSWSHSQIHRKRLLTPLPLAPEFLDVNRAVLPPFLPEEEPLEYLESERTAMEGDEDVLDEQFLTKTGLSSLWQANPFREGAQNPRTLQTSWNRWREMRLRRQRSQRNANRLAIMDQLIAIQELKNRRKSDKRGAKTSTNASKHQKDRETEAEMNQVGYALVTGASRGIGRAIAVELSRWGIPLILIARDIERLTTLACDLKACYGVDCCILQADLTKPGVREAVCETISDAGLPVDILVNNAGFSSQGASVDLPIKQVNDMIALNIQAVSTLTHFFAKEMKVRKRGRILMVSSVCGAVAGVPTVAVYSATKAFEKTFSTSLAKELEPFGVGMTCLLPGAVRDTEFRSRSNSRDALCWKVPFYLKSPHQVAEMGVRALLRGETEVTPGWMNRLFLKVLQPALPPRIHNLIAETMWNPVPFPFTKKSDLLDSNLWAQGNAALPLQSSATLRRFVLDPLPRLLQLEERFSSAPDEPKTPEFPSPSDTPDNSTATEVAPSISNGTGTRNESLQAESFHAAERGDGTSENSHDSRSYK